MADLTLFESTGALTHYTQKQRQILSAAIDVFAEKGYANTSTREIAARAGVAEGNLFARFHSKRGLLNAIIEPVLAGIFPREISSMLQGVLSTPHPSLEAFVTAVITDRVTLVQHNQNLVKVLITELMGQEAVRKLLMDQLPTRYFAAMEKQFAALKATGELRDWPTNAILASLWTTLGGTVVAHLYFGQPLDQAAVDRTISSIVRTLQP